MEDDKYTNRTMERKIGTTKSGRITTNAWLAANMRKGGKEARRGADVKPEPEPEPEPEEEEKEKAALLVM